MKYKFRTRPYRHQVRGMKKAIRQFREGRGVAFLMEPRTGKTKTTIDTISALHHMNGLRKVVIVAPNRVLGTWVTEFGTHCPLTHHITVWDGKTRRNGGVYTPIPTVTMADLQIVLVNYEAFGTPGKKTASGRRSRASGRFKHRQLLQRWVGHDDAACVLDEGHKIKSPSGKASNMIVSMRPMFRYRFLLTGTPVTKAKRAHDIYMQWQWVNPVRFADWGSTVEQFKNHTGRWITSNGYPQWVGQRPRGMEDLREGIHADGIVVRREDCFDLPPRQPRIVPIQLSATTAHHYDEMAAEMVTRLQTGDIAEASIPLVVTLRLLQLTSGFVGVDKFRNGRRLVRRVGHEKLSALKELLVEETVEREEKVVIAARFKPDLTAIAKLCRHLDMPVWEIRGGIHRRDSDAAIHDFRAHTDGPAAMVIQPQAAGLGIDLSTSHHMVWYSLTPSWVDFTQTCDRIALSQRSTMFTYLLASGTVDDLLYQTLLADGDVARTIMTRPQSILRR